MMLRWVTVGAPGDADVGSNLSSAWRREDIFGRWGCLSNLSVLKYLRSATKPAKPEVIFNCELYSAA